jgi:multicomponent Na+:H+ antiporter subunit D
VLICVSALQCAVMSGDLLTIFLAFQVAALSVVVAASAGHEDDRRVLPGAFLALLSLGLAGAIFLTGLALARETLGGLDIQMSAGLTASKSVNSALAAGLILMLGAALCWAASAPAAAWAPVLFGRGATLSSLVLAGAFAIAGFAILTRLYALALAQPAHGAPFSLFIGVAGAATVIVAALRAASAQCVRRLAGYALGVQMGGAMIGLALAGDGAAAGLLHILHAGAMAIILHAAGVRFRDTARASTPIARLDGAGRRTPFVAAGVTIALLALVAAPATAPFLSKWLILEASLERGWGWAAAALVFGSLAGVLVTGRVIERMYFRAPHIEAPSKHWGHLSLSACIAASAAWLIVCGLEGTTPLAAAQAVIFPLFAGAGAP